jgi:hypothetical protein
VPATIAQLISAAVQTRGRGQNATHSQSSATLDVAQGDGLSSLPSLPALARGNMSKPIPDKAEVALEYPDKFYVGTFAHTSRFEAHLDAAGLTLILERPGAEDVRKSVHMHLSFGLLAAIMRELALNVDAIPKDDVAHRAQLAEAVGQLHEALR